MSEHPLTQRVKALIGFRAVFVTLLLGAIYLFKIRYFALPYPSAISYFIISLYVLTIIYSLLLYKTKNLFLFAYIQLVLDVIAEIVLIYITGGIESWFSFTLILTVLSSSIILNKKAGYVIASLSSILYGVLIDLQFYNVLPIPYEIITTERVFLYNIFIHIMSLYITAYLSGYLSHRLEKTVQKLKEKDTNLRDLEFFNTKVIESLPSGLFTTDLEGTITIFNKAAEKIIDSDKDRVIGAKIDSVLPFLKLPLKEGRREAILRSDKLEERIIGVNISSLEDISGNETGYIGIFQDLTQMKKLESEMKRQEKLVAIGELSANIAHEIRNPLASLKGSIEMLKEGKIPDKHRDKLMNIAVSEMERLDRIIKDFLTYSRPKPLKLQKMDIHSILNETLDLLQNIEKNNDNVTIKKEFRGSLVISADPEKIRQVFWNLGINSFEAMPGGGEIAVKTYDNAQSVTIIFSDTGSGIDPEDTESIFFPFYTTKNDGTGLGLSIAYRIIEEHSGRISMNSSPGTKTVFEIILPKEHER
jgi:two-component system sensor histidine kinase PilS (NtrC family)